MYMHIQISFIVELKPKKCEVSKVRERRVRWLCKSCRTAIISRDKYSYAFKI